MPRDHINDATDRARNGDGPSGPERMLIGGLVAIATVAGLVFVGAWLAGR